MWAGFGCLFAASLPRRTRPGIAPFPYSPHHFFIEDGRHERFIRNVRPLGAKAALRGRFESATGMLFGVAEDDAKEA